MHLYKVENKIMQLPVLDTGIERINISLSDRMYVTIKFANSSVWLTSLIKSIWSKNFKT